MFAARYKKTLLEKIKNIFWPDIGWSRFFKYLLHKLSRIKGSTASIANGFAFGAAASFTPFMGFHIIIGAICARLTGGSVIAAAVGTIIGNPWTFPFIWILVYQTGYALLNFFGYADSETAVDLTQLDFHVVLNNFKDIFIPMIFGSIPHFIWAWFLHYYLIKYFLDKKQQKRKTIKIK